MPEMISNLDGSKLPLPSYYFWPHHRPYAHLHSFQPSTLPFHSCRWEFRPAAFNSCIYSWEMTFVLGPTVRLPCPTAAANPFTQIMHSSCTLTATHSNPRSARRKKIQFTTKFLDAQSKRTVCTSSLAKIPYLKTNIYLALFFVYLTMFRRVYGLK
jgi:hypothetical protein